jgi:hypothetical protein
MLSTIIGDLFDLFGDERGTIGQSHVAGRQLAKKRASSGVKEREPFEIEYRDVIGATGCERLVAHATQLFHHWPTAPPLADRVAFNLEHVAVASVRTREV